jgi:hypothetical protein
LKYLKNIQIEKNKIKLIEKVKIIKKDIEENNINIELEDKINNVEVMTDILDNVVNQGNNICHDVESKTSESSPSSLFNLFGRVDDNNINNILQMKDVVIDKDIVVNMKETPNEVIPIIDNFEKKLLVNKEKDLQEKQEVKYDFYNPPPPPPLPTKIISPPPPPIERKSVNLQDGN